VGVRPYPRGVASESGGSKLARDVLVNVVANLIAAAVIYLAGAAAGLLPVQTWLVALSAVVAFAALCLAVVAVIGLFSWADKRVAVSQFVALTSAAGVPVGFLPHLIRRTDDTESLVPIAYVSAVLLVISLAALLWGRVSRRRRDRRVRVERGRAGSQRI
jgi:hypothetical protein